MTAAEEARSLDATDHPLQALDAYRKAVARREADLDDYLNMTAILFECTDEGFAAYHRVPEHLERTALGRAHEVLDQADQRFGWHPETEFWRRYIRFIREGAMPFYAEAETLVRSDMLVPVVHLISGPRAAKYAEDARALLDSVRLGRTERERYIKSVLESHVHDRLLGRQG